MINKSELATRIFAGVIKCVTGKTAILEHKFHPSRKWRFDLAIPDWKVAIELEGGIWTNGRHVRGTGYLKDMEKYNQAQILGWIVLRYSPEQKAEALNDLEAFRRSLAER